MREYVRNKFNKRNKADLALLAHLCRFTAGPQKANAVPFSFLSSSFLTLYFCRTYARFYAKRGLSVAAGANPLSLFPPLMACKNGPSRKKPPKKRKKGLRSREDGGRAASSVTRREGRGSHEKSGRGKQRAAVVKKEAKNHG